MKPKINKLYMHNLSNGAHCNFMDAISAKYNGKEVLRTRLKNELATFDSMLEKNSNRSASQGKASCLTAFGKTTGYAATDCWDFSTW